MFALKRLIGLAKFQFLTSGRGFQFIPDRVQYMMIITLQNKYVNYDHLGECSPEKDCLW